MISPDPFAHDHALYACDPKQSRGRQYPEPDDELRSVYQHDRARIVHSGAFRKLTGKTQVFISHENDYYRTRLTHSLEVAQIARTVARCLRVNEDLTECVALAHDLGHPPFGHTGEQALNEMMDAYGGFNHNDQTIRVLTFLEKIYPAFGGLNVSWETLEGVVKHNGPFEKSSILSETIKTINSIWPLDLYRYSSIEAQIAHMCDDIAYNAHDLDDGLRAHLFSIDEVASHITLIGLIIETLHRNSLKLETTHLRHGLIRHLINDLTVDLIKETQARLANVAPTSVEDSRCAHQSLVAHSSIGVKHLNDLKSFLHDRMYHHYHLNRTARKAHHMICEMFKLFIQHPDCLPPEWYSKHTSLTNQQELARHITDYIAGMTDRYAYIEYRHLFDHD